MNKTRSEASKPTKPRNLAPVPAGYVGRKVRRRVAKKEGKLFLGRGWAAPPPPVVHTMQEID